MRSNYDQVVRLFRSGSITRWHTAQHIPGQSVADHSWRVVQVLKIIFGGAHEVPPSLLWWAIDHDIGEMATGDIPAYVKWRSKPIQRECERLEHEWAARYEVDLPNGNLLPDEFREALTAADRLEAAMYCLEQQEQGNTMARWAFCLLIAKLDDALTPDLTKPEEPMPMWQHGALELLEGIQIAWEAAGGKWVDEKELDDHD